MTCAEVALVRVFYCFTPSARPAGGAGAEEGERKRTHPEVAPACVLASSHAFFSFNPCNCVPLNSPPPETNGEWILFPLVYRYRNPAHWVCQSHLPEATQLISFSMRISHLWKRKLAASCHSGSPEEALLSYLITTEPRMGGQASQPDAPSLVSLGRPVFHAFPQLPTLNRRQM